jgi:DNA-binding transcriptional LysR family regulator
MDLLSHLSAFAILAEELHFGAAADRLGIAQPNLSNRIKRLEEHFGFRIFIRNSRSVQLTSEGTSLLSETLSLLRQAERVERLRASVQPIATWRLSVPPDIDPSIMQTIVQTAHSDYEMQVEWEICTAANQLAELEVGRCDLALIKGALPQKPTGLTETTFAQPLGAVRRRQKQTTITEPNPISLAELHDYELAMPSRTSAAAWFDSIMSTCARFGFTPTRLHESDSPSTLHTTLLTRNAVSFEPEHKHRHPDLEWRPIFGEPLIHPMSVLHQKKSAFVQLTIDALLLHGFQPFDGSNAVAPEPQLRPWMEHEQ